MSMAVARVVGQTAATAPITETHLVRVWTTETGYPHIAPTSFAETRDGYLWQPHAV